MRVYKVSYPCQVVFRNRIGLSEGNSCRKDRLLNIFFVLGMDERPWDVGALVALIRWKILEKIIRPTSTYSNAPLEPGPRSSEEPQCWHSSSCQEASKCLSIPNQDRLPRSPLPQDLCRGRHYPRYLRWRQVWRSWNGWGVLISSYSPTLYFLIHLLPRSDEGRERIGTYLADEGSGHIG
jgi:hypothetical protein